MGSSKQAQSKESKYKPIDFLKSPVTPRILSAVAMGYRTKEEMAGIQSSLTLTNNGKKEDKYLPFGTLNAYLSRNRNLTTEHYLAVTNAIKTKRRSNERLTKSKETYIYEINYDKLISEFEDYTNKQIKLSASLVENMLSNIARRTDLILHKLGKYKILQKNRKDYRAAKRQVRELERLLQYYNLMAAKLDSFLNLICSSHIDISFLDRIHLQYTLESHFYMHLLSQKNDRGLIDIFEVILNSIVKKELIEFPALSSGKNAGISAKYTIKINEDLPYLNAVANVWGEKDSLDLLF
ncbi:MAG TPA: hypothetical protein HA362_05415 [Nanoarchaeota archaeon]|nr:hypothetical protein [Nanoarchaeota archaeon]